MLKEEQNCIVRGDDMSDFREYSAAFMDHQSDLAHYGVKGMRWRDHLKKLADDAKYHLKYDVGIGLKKDINDTQKVINRLAKDEVNIFLKRRLI